MPSQSDYLVLLARQPQTIFHADDLARLWNIQNPNTLYVLLSRLTRKKLLVRLVQGLYSLMPLEKIDPLLLGLKLLHGFGYVSTETILVQEGFIAQIIPHITLISSRSRRFRIGPYSFISRQLQDSFLYHPAGIVEENGILRANFFRAAADLLYFNPKAYVDGMKRIDVSQLRAMQKQIGYPLIPFHHVASA